MLQSMGLQRVRQDLATEQQQIRCLFGLPWWLSGKESACNEEEAGDVVSTLESGRSPGEGKGYQFQYFGLENFMNCTVYEVAKSLTRLSDFHCALKLLRISKQQQQSIKLKMGPSKLGALCT